MCSVFSVSNDPFWSQKRRIERVRSVANAPNNHLKCILVLFYHAFYIYICTEDLHISTPNTYIKTPKAYCIP